MNPNPQTPPTPPPCSCRCCTGTWTGRSSPGDPATCACVARNTLWCACNTCRAPSLDDTAGGTGIEGPRLGTLLPARAWRGVPFGALAIPAALRRLIPRGASSPDTAGGSVAWYRRGLRLPIPQGTPSPDIAGSSVAWYRRGYRKGGPSCVLGAVGWAGTI